MGITIQDVLAAFGGMLSGITQAILAVAFGFAMMPSALAYVIGIVGCLGFQSTIPISFQAETIAMAGNLGKNRSERLSMVILAGIAMTIIGIFGTLQSIVDFAGANVVAAMMAGVGIILCKLSIDIAKKNPKIGSISMVVAVLTYLFTQSLVYTFAFAIIIASLTAYFFKIDTKFPDDVEDRFHFQMPTISLRVVRGALALMCLTIGGNIAFGGISASISGVNANIDHLTIYTGLADMVSSLFGGSPLSVVIAPTAAAPNPKISAILFMALMVIVLLTKSITKIAKFISSESVAGALFVLGAIITIPENLSVAFANASPRSALASSVALAVTAISDPFFGLIAGIIVNILAVPLGLA